MSETTLGGDGVVAPEGEANLSYESELADAVFNQPLSSLPHRPMVTVKAEATARQAIEAMHSNAVSCVLVMDGEELVGIFTERDVVGRVVAQGVDLDATCVSEVMSSDPDTLPLTISLAYALNTMSVKGYRHVPVVTDDGRPVAMVSQRDIVDWMVELFPAAVLNLPPTSGIYPISAEGG
jgi:CBS domain-containing protein